MLLAAHVVDDKNSAERNTPFQGRNFCCAISFFVGRKMLPHISNFGMVGVQHDDDDDGVVVAVVVAVVLWVVDVVWCCCFDFNSVRNWSALDKRSKSVPN